MKFWSVVGARPQFIKAAPVAMALSTACTEHQILHTGQHFDKDMSDVFFSELGIPAPAINLKIHGGGHGSMTGRMIAALEECFLSGRPDVVIIYGDTNSTLAAAIAAVKLHIPIAHVEAGMRRYDNTIPEEVNRRLADAISSYLFCSSEQYAENLRQEFVTEGVHVVGDTTYDSFHLFDRLAQTPLSCIAKQGFALCTIHRAINTDNPNRLRKIASLLGIAGREVVMPLHPRTRERIALHGIRLPDNVTAIDPATYLEMLGLLRRSAFVITDSGGLQKDAAFANQRCIVLNSDTPWIELKTLDANRPVDLDAASFANAIVWAAEPLRDFSNPYYNGRSASEQIAEVLRAHKPMRNMVGIETD